MRRRTLRICLASEPVIVQVNRAIGLADTIAVAHATDVVLDETGLVPAAAEAALGEGALDYATYLKLVDALELDTPVVVRPQPTDDAYRSALQFLQGAAPASA